MITLEQVSSVLPLDLREELKDVLTGFYNNPLSVEFKKYLKQHKTANERVTRFLNQRVRTIAIIIQDLETK